MVRSYFARRLAYMVLCLFVVATMVFFMFRLLPGNPIGALMDPSLDAEAVKMLEQRFGLNEPLQKQYLLYMRNLIQGDFGISFFYRKSAIEVLTDKIFNTIVLAITALVLAYSIGILAGVWMAWRRGSKGETLLILLSLFFRSAPVFWVGMLVIMLFSYKLGWFPNGGIRTPGYEVSNLLMKYLSLDFLHHLALPALVYALYHMSTPMLLMRNTITEVMNEDFIEMARAKGVSKTGIMYHHAARNALLPVVTSFSISAGLAVGGQVLIEYVFGWPGLGREIVLAAQRYDYPVAQASFIMLSATVMMMNFFADILYGILDPRISYQ
jgi:ABC-type dipeptide/oligopeptide/nickel transport system permease component